MRGLAAAITVAATALTSGCASIWSRGIVLDEQGHLVRTASVTVTSEAGSGTVAEMPTDSFGCFLVARVAPKGERKFRLSVAAPGYAPATFDFGLETPILIAKLAKEDSGTRSEIHPASLDEQDDKWTPYCNPPSPPGAQQLSPGARSQTRDATRSGLEVLKGP
jgi:hypothetical protein